MSRLDFIGLCIDGALTFGLAATAILAGAAAVGLYLVGRQLYRLTRWTAERARHRSDLARMKRQPAPRPPTSPQACDDYWTIRRTWHMATREEAHK